jgi:short-subunit dehydrogenase
MKKPMQFSKRWIVVTGASSGLGKAIAIQLASKHQANLILVARRLEKLEELKHSLEKNYSVHCKTIAADLSNINNIERMFRESIQNEEVYGVILNAGITYFGEHQQLPWDQFEQLLATNVSGIVKAVELYLPYLSERSQGGSIMLVSSVAGLLPVPYQAAYSGSKAFITHYGLALNEELRGDNVSLTVFSPGGIATEMTHSSGLAAQFEGSSVLQSPEQCASEAIQAMESRHALYVPGWINRLQLFGARLLPRSLLIFFAGKLYRKALETKRNKQSSS